MALPRQKPRRLAEKLLHIRKAMNLSQNEMIVRLGFRGELIQAHISAYERKRENRVPPLGVVLQYARCVGVTMEMIVDDSLDLPEKLPVGTHGQKAQKRLSKLSSRNIRGTTVKRGDRHSR
jgi:transcriptional regulator with XRE-family HTH domain